MDHYRQVAIWTFGSVYQEPCKITGLDLSGMHDGIKYIIADAVFLRQPTQGDVVSRMASTSITHASGHVFGPHDPHGAL